MYAVSVAEFTIEGTADILVNKYIPLWGCPVSILSDNGFQFCSKAVSCYLQARHAQNFDKFLTS